MKRRITFGRGSAVALTFGVVVLLAAPPAEAQRWGRPRVPQAGACFYQNANFQGDYFCVPADEAIDEMPSGLNDRISSIRTFGNVEVTVYRNPGFGGRSTRFNEDVSNLQQEGWNDTLSSLQVRRSGGFGGGWNGGGGGGWNGGGGNGGNRPTNVDRVIRRAYQDLLEREPDQDGLREYRRRMLDDGWSEAEVREALRRSPEYRQRNQVTRGGRGEQNYQMSRERAQDIVRRAYLSTLGREPDAGAEGFVERVLRDRWTEQDVVRELRKSAEYRNRRPPQ